MPGIRLSTRPDGRDVAEGLRGQVVRLRSAALPRAADAAENTGETVSQFALSSSKRVARALRKRQPSAATSFATLLPPMLRTGARLAERHPAIIAAAGLGVAAIGIAAWRRQRRTASVEAPDAAEDQPAVREL